MTGQAGLDFFLGAVLSVSGGRQQQAGRQGAPVMAAARGADCPAVRVAGVAGVPRDAASPSSVTSSGPRRSDIPLSIVSEAAACRYSRARCLAIEKSRWTGRFVAARLPGRHSAAPAPIPPRRGGSALSCRSPGPPIQVLFSAALPGGAVTGTSRGSQA